MKKLSMLKNASMKDKARAAAINSNPIAKTFVSAVSGARARL